MRMSKRASLAAGICLAAVFIIFIFAPSLSFAGPAVQRVKSPGGIEAWLVEDHSVAVLAMRMGFRGGSAEDPPDRLGLANMTAGLLDEGAGDLDAQAFRSRLDDNSIGLGFDDSRDVFIGYLKTLSANRDMAFELMALALTKPRFEAEAIDRVRHGVAISRFSSARKLKTITMCATSSVSPRIMTKRWPSGVTSYSRTKALD